MHAALHCASAGKCKSMYLPPNRRAALCTKSRMIRGNELKVAFSVAALAFEGDLSTSIFHLQLITKNVPDWSVKARVIAVFHTSAGHVRLHCELRARPGCRALC